MKLGQIFKWETDKAHGHDRRWKYHVFICPEDAQEGNTFLFISKADYGCDYKILKKDYPFLDFEESYISCGRIVCYSDPELAASRIEEVGQLKMEHLRELRTAVLDSDQLERRYILRVGNALNAAL